MTPKKPTLSVPETVILEIVWSLSVKSAGKGLSDSADAGEVDAGEIQIICQLIILLSVDPHPWQ